MLELEQFTAFMREGPSAFIKPKPSDTDSPRRKGFQKPGRTFKKPTRIEPDGPKDDSTGSFARRLLEVSKFGDAQRFPRAQVLLGDDVALSYLPDHLYYFRNSADRMYHTVLLEIDEPASAFLKRPAFRNVADLDMLEDAMSRICQSVLRGFAHGQGTASRHIRPAGVPGGKQEETICVISILDDRNRDEKSNLVSFGTVIDETLESFSIRQEAINWEESLATEYLTRVHERHFRRLATTDWSRAFISVKERRCARDLTDECAKPEINEESLRQCAVALLEEIALGYGLRARDGHRLRCERLVSDHDIGVDPKSASEPGFSNPFQGMVIKDEKLRLLGYVVYCLDDVHKADELRAALSAHNRFHNVLVIYPSGNGAELELWQGKERLKGRLVKQGRQYQNEGRIVNLLSRFFVVSRNRIRRPSELAKELAFRAVYLKRLALGILSDGKVDALDRMYSEFKQSLIHDLSKEEFADAYAQTLTYGLLTARWMSVDEYRDERFTRHNAARHLPPTSPFLVSFFKEAFTAVLETKLDWLLDDIADLLDRTDVRDVFSPEKTTDETTGHDPVIHFYEPFLAAYDAKLRKARGVYYTPQPVVSFIVRSVDDILRTEFKLEDGLADTATWGDMQKRFPNLELPSHAKPADFFVQILDPATGTGTFVVEVIDRIYSTMCAKWGALSDKERDQKWSKYVASFLLPRLNAFELMMASYAVAHLKIGLKLKETRCDLPKGRRFGIYLTNALEGPEETAQGDLFNQFVGKEAEAAAEVKEHAAMTVVVGNPPYSGHSANTGEWITKLLRGSDTFLRKKTENYFESQGKPLGERNPKWLNDDYVKFIRLSQWYLSRSGTGVHGMITNHSYLDSSTFRGMRESLSRFYSAIRVVDLRGSIKRADDDGVADENVFDIQQGVAVGVMFRSPRATSSPSVRHISLKGTCSEKYSHLNTNSSESLVELDVAMNSPFFLMIPTGNMTAEHYTKWPSVTDLFGTYSLGIVTARDKLTVSWSEEELWRRIETLSALPTEDARKALKLPADARDWRVAWAQEELNRTGPDKGLIVRYNYRPFCSRLTYYTGSSRGFHCMPRGEVMNQFAHKNNWGIQLCRQLAREPWQHILATNGVTDSDYVSNRTRERGYTFPVFVYESPSYMPDAAPGKRTSNVVEEFGATLSASVGKKWTHSCTPSPAYLGPDEFVSYVYALLHSPSYRIRYAKLLRADFPRLPVQTCSELFDRLHMLGRELVDLHLMDWERLKARGKTPEVLTTFPQTGTNKVEEAGESGKKLKVVDGVGRAYINKTQYFDNVPQEVWDFHIGGYQVCHKWLDDRKKAKRTLSDDDIQHYCRIVAVLKRTIEIMAEIDDAIDQHGGWPDAFVTDGGNGGEA